MDRLPTFDTEARCSDGRTVYCNGQRGQCSVVLATLGDDGCLHRGEGWTRGGDGALRTTKEAAFRLKQLGQMRNRRRFRGDRMLRGSETLPDVIVRPEVFVCPLCEIRTRNLVDPIRLGARLPFDDDGDLPAEFWEVE